MFPAQFDSLHPWYADRAGLESLINDQPNDHTDYNNAQNWQPAQRYNALMSRSSDVNAVNVSANVRVIASVH